MEIGAHDIGQGAWTALAQIAADALALDIEEIEFPSGTSDLPDAGIAGGSAHTAIAGMAIHNAGAEVIARLAELATNDRRSPLFGLFPTRARFCDKFKDLGYFKSYIRPRTPRTPRTKLAAAPSRFCHHSAFCRLVIPQFLGRFLPFQR